MDTDVIFIPADTLIDPPSDNDTVAVTEVDTDSTVIEISSDSDLPNPTANAPTPGTVFFNLQAHLLRASLRTGIDTIGVT